MNKVVLVGKISNINHLDKVSYITVCTYHNGTYQYIPVTVFKSEFFKKYFYEQKWCTIEGHINVNKYKDQYKTEIIADHINFTGEATEIDKTIQEVYHSQQLE